MGKIYPHPQWKDTGDSKETIDDEPALVTKLEVGNTSTHITKDGDGNMTFDDAVTGSKTLAELSAGGGGGVDTSGTPVANDFAKFTDADTIEGRSYTEVKQDLSLEDSDINALITATKLDDLTAPDDTTDLDATDALHGLMSKADKGKLDGIEAGADQTDATNVAAAGAVMADGSVPVTAYVDITEAAEPDAPAANNLRLHALDENGFSVLAYKDSGGMVRKFVKDAVFIAYNDSGDTIAAPRAVYASGSTGTVPTIALAKANSSDTMPAIGVTLESIANGAYGRIMQVGLLEDVNTLAFTSGDILYVSAATAGMPTDTPPAYPNIRQELGTVLVDSETVGSIQIIARTAFDDSLISIVPSLEGSPTEDLATKAPTSEWAFDHDAATTGVHGAGAETLLNTGDVGTMAAETATDYLAIANLENPPTEDEATKAPTSEWAFDHAAATATHGAADIADVSDIAVDANLSVAAQAVVTAGACDVDANLSATAQGIITNALVHTDVDDTPVDGETDVPVSSNWAYDHAALTEAHSATGAVVGTTNEQTLTNKTILATTNVVEEISTVASSATPAPTGGSLRNFYTITALAAAAEFAAPSGTPANANKLIIRIKDNGTARALTWNAIYRAMEFALPTTTVISKTMYLGFIYNSADSKWDMVAINEEA